MLKAAFSLPIKKKYSLDNIDDISKNLQLKKDEIEKDIDSFHYVDTADDKRKSLYI